MLHIIADIGKPGCREREKRHFPGFNNTPSDESEQTRSRRYIPHGYGDHDEFRPHNSFQEPEYTDVGLDWKSQPRYIPSPHNQDHNTEVWPDEWKSLRTFPWMTAKTKKEWSLHPEGYDPAVKCSFDGVHRATATSSREGINGQTLGRAHLAVDKRNGIGLASLGDKNYQAVEYSPHFHKLGSTRPIVDFGGNAKPNTDTFVPLQELPPITKESFRAIERHRQRQDEVGQVQDLDSWQAAAPLQGPGHPLQVAPSQPAIQEGSA